MKTRRRLLLAGLTVLVLAAGFLLWVPGRRAADSAADGDQARAQAVYAGHARHQPGSHPAAAARTRGSGLFQYEEPTGRQFDREAVFDPEPPPYAPAPDGVREYTLVIEEDVPHEVAPGVVMPAWTFNRTVPGPVLRVVEGETLRVKLINKGKLPHTIHFHGIHPANMDGVFELVPPGGEFVYEFEAKPYGIMPYHCHSMPTQQHIHNGLYGMVIVDPKGGRRPMRELAMMMSAFDLDRDGEADFYAWNGRSFQYADHPIELEAGEPVRMYVVNMFEEKMVPHIHGNLYQFYPSGTARRPAEYTDVKTLNIAERGILEFSYEHPGNYMFQCHVTEHMEQGLMGWFRVTEEDRVAQRD